MHINKNLSEAAKFNPTKRTYQRNLISLCQDIEKDEITLPLYQRDVSWTIAKCVDLLNYQLLGKAPVSPISVNEIKRSTGDKAVAQISFIEREVIDTNNIKSGQLSVVDGQQRLTTNYKAYLNHDDFRNIVLDLSKGKFIVVENSIKNHQVPVGILLNKDLSVFSEYTNKKTTLKKDAIKDLLLSVRSKLHDYNYTINLAEDLVEDEQIEWFEVLNNAGSRVSRIQMKFSKLRLDGIDIYSQYTRKFIDAIEQAGLDLFDMKNTEVSIPIATLNCAYEVIMNKEHSPNFTPIPSDTRENQICAMTSEQIIKSFSITLKALSEALDFIEMNNLSTPNRIDYVTYLTGFFVFNGDDSISENRKASIIEWYNNVKFTNKSNSERRNFFSDLLKI